MQLVGDENERAIPTNPMQVEDAISRTLHTGDCLDLSMQLVAGRSMKVRMDFGDCFIGLEKVLSLTYIFMVF